MYQFQFRRWYHLVLLTMVVAMPVVTLFGQTGTSITPDLADARVHVAGPDLVFLDGVVIDGQPYAVYLSADENGRWRVTSVEVIDTRALPPDVFLDMTSLSATGTGELRIDNIYLDGQFYSGTVTFDPSYQRIQEFQFGATDVPADTFGVFGNAPTDEEPTPAEEPPPAEEQSPRDELLTARDTILHRIDAYAAQGAARLDRLDTRINQLSKRVDSAVAEGETAVRHLLERVTAAPAVDAMAPTLSLARARSEMATVDPIDVGAGRAVSGSWETAGPYSVVQTDSAARFAKLVLPYRQDSQPRLYRMLTRAIGDGWAGVGMHLGVSGVEAPAGYGHGRSILVWLTRDAHTYGDVTTFLEVYISYDDVTMNRVAQSALDSDLSTTTALEVLMDPGAGMITVAVDGIEQFRYRVNMAQGTGLELALRALGRGSFSDLEVRRR